MRYLTIGLTLLIGAACGSETSGLPDTGSPDAAVADAAPPDGDVPLPCNADTAEGLMGCVERERYLTDLEFVAQERDNGSPHWQAVQDLCFDRFTQYGLTVELHDYGTGINVIGVLPGTGAEDEQVIVSAHYDSVAGCPGADDNASGTSGVLEAARVLAMGSYRRTLIVACWDEEEDGLIGSDAYAQRAFGLGENIMAMYSLEMIGFKADFPGGQMIPGGFDAVFPVEYAAVEANEFRGDFIAAVYDETGSQIQADDMEELGLLVDLNVVTLGLSDALKNNAALNDLRRSDHGSFWLLDYPGIMVTDTADFRNTAYHCQDGDDVVTRLDHDFATQVVQVVVGSAARMLELF